MLSSKEAATKKFETTVEEIMDAGAKAIYEMEKEVPATKLIEDVLGHVIARAGAIWVIDMQRKED